MTQARERRRQAHGLAAHEPAGGDEHSASVQRKGSGSGSPGECGGPAGPASTALPPEVPHRTAPASTASQGVARMVTDWRFDFEGQSVAGGAAADPAARSMN